MSFEAQSLFESGLKDYYENRFEEALVKYHAAAAMGHGGAMNAISAALFLGEGVEKDVVEAIKWIKLSIETGELRAMRNLALCFRDGVPDAGIAVDRTEAMRLMQQAADGGLENAMCDLADWLRELSDPAAVEWYMKGADAGNLYCMRRLGSLHRNGACGLQPDNSKALPWYERAAATGDVDSIAILAVFLQEVGDLVRAVELYSKAADGGNATAMFNLAVCYEVGSGVAKSTERAVELYERATELDSDRAMVNLASCYEDGMGVAKSAEKAVELYERAADLGNIDAMSNLALCYKNGTGVTKSAEKAVELYERAIELGDAGAVFSLALCYEDGEGVEKSTEKAVELYERAIELGCDRAMVNLALWYENGTGVAKSAEKAVELYQRAADLGNASAMLNLGACYASGSGVAASMRIGVEFTLRASALGQTKAKQLIDSGVSMDAHETFYVAVTGLLSRGVPDSAMARKLLKARLAKHGRVSLGDFVFDGDNFPLDRIGDALRLFAEFKHSIQSMQFALRLGKERPLACNAEQQRWFNRVAELVGGAAFDDGDKIVLMQVALLFRKEVPLELYEALKRMCDARVAMLTVKSVLPLVRVLEELDRAVRSLEFSDKARFVLRACVFGALCEHLLAAELPSDLMSETALETTLLWLGVVRQAEFFGGVAMERVAVVARDVEARLRNDKAARSKYAMILVRDLKRRHLLLATTGDTDSAATWCAIV